ncbi:hypothetical protein FKM82_017116 [Ascaphus truei]
MLLPVTVLFSLALVTRCLPIEEPEEGGKHWVVLVAGSNGWYNYRHQADVCHSYQIVKRNGIPDEQIVVMMYDDIADNEESWGPLVLLFPWFCLIAGSLFTVYATTAANAKESSYACYYDELRDTYLGDLYSVTWMEDSDSEDLTKETLHKQFILVKQHTNTSHVMQYGNRTISLMKVKQFQGSGKKVVPPVALEPVKHLDLTPSPDVPLAILKRKLMATNDIVKARQIVAEIKSHQEAKELIKESMRKIVYLVTGSEEIAEDILSDKLIINEPVCYRGAAEHFKAHCFNWHTPLYEYAMRQLYALVNLCEVGYPVERIQLAMDKVCLGGY